MKHFYNFKCNIGNLKKNINKYDCFIHMVITRHIYELTIKSSILIFFRFIHVFGFDLMFLKTFARRQIKRDAISDRL